VENRPSDLRRSGHGSGALGLTIPCLLGLSLGVMPATGAEPRRPNIVYIMADDLGYGDLGCNGQREIRTPNIDGLAASGTRFTHAYAGAAVCAPSRCVLMTGLHTGHSRVRDNQGLRETVPAAERGQKNRIPLEPEDLTVAEVLKSAGYATAIFGKWGLGEPGSTGVPTRQGFDRWLGFLNQDHAVDYYTDHLWQGEERLAIAANEGGRRGQYVHDLFAERALEFIGENRSRPFFLYLAFTIPHADYEVPGLGPYADEPWSDFEKTYAAMVSRMDSDVGKVLERLRSLKLEGDTVVFFCSDNGAPGVSEKSRFRSGSTFRGQKGTFYEGGLRVPMIVRWPDKVPAGAVSSSVWSFVDFLPTAAELAHAEMPGRLDGMSVVPTLLGRPQDLGTRTLYWENRRGQAARQGPWKAVRPEFGAKLELYDLDGDPGETRDLAAERADVAARLESWMEHARIPSPYYPTVTSPSRRKADRR
jgi:arylsulfatase A-like enzyme